jgi:hypothetical protein
MGAPHGDATGGAGGFGGGDDVPQAATTARNAMKRTRRELSHRPVHSGLPPIAAGA